MVDAAMNRAAALLIISAWVVASPVAHAEERSASDTLVDIMTGADPTARLESGLGVALGAYADSLQRAETADALDPSQVPSLRRERLDFDSLSRDARTEPGADEAEGDLWADEGGRDESDFSNQAFETRDSSLDPLSPYESTGGIHAGE
jgi:hypothetical protein